LSPDERGFIVQIRETTTLPAAHDWLFIQPPEDEAVLAVRPGFDASAVVRSACGTRRSP